MRDDVLDDACIDGENILVVNISENEIGRILSSFINGRFSLILTNNISSKEEGEKIAKVCGATCSYININHGERREKRLYKSTWREDMGKNKECITLFTSGSSGNKKPVVISKEALLKCAKFMNKRIDNKNTDREIIQGATDHAFVIGRVISCELSNTKYEIVSRVIPSKKRIERLFEGATGFSAMPTTLMSILKDTCNASLLKKKIRYMQVGAMKLSEDEKKRIVQALPNTDIFMHYGMTEYMRITFININKEIDKLHTEGRASDGTKIEIRDMKTGKVLPRNSIGEIFVKGGHLLEGYKIIKGLQLDLDENGYFRTKDTGYMDDEDYLVHCGRVDSLFKVNGRFISGINLQKRIEDQMNELEGEIIVLPPSIYSEKKNSVNSS